MENAMDLMNTKDAAEYLGLAMSTLEKWRTMEPRFGPPIVRLGAQVRYRKTDLDAFVEGAVEGA